MLRSSVVLFFFFFFVCNSQSSEKINTFRVVSYNVENLFDCENDSLTKDDEFTFLGDRHWTYTKYKKKISDISKVIVAIGGWSAPSLVGLCEVENKKVLIDLVRYSPLKELNYSFVHQESTDARGIDVALLYQKKQFRLIHNEFLSISDSEKRFRTRDILYAQGIVPSGDTLHVFVNHWPSRLGGELESESKRLLVASVLREKINEIIEHSTSPFIIVMGDFNDSPENKSVSEVLAAECLGNKEVINTSLYNLFCGFHEKGEGSHKMAGEWTMLDQIIVSGTFLNDNVVLRTKPDNASVFMQDFLIEEDEKNLGFRPKRTYQGFKYVGGVSDHLPVYVDFIMEMKE